MKPAQLRILFWLGVAMCFVVAGLELRTHPVIGVIALVVGCTLAFVSWNGTRDRERVLVAGMQGDVETLRKIAKKIPPASISALVALAVFEGTAYVEAMPEHQICRCDDPNCSIHFLNDEMSMFLALLRDSEDGRWRRHVEEATKHTRNMPTSGLQGRLAGELTWIRAATMSFGLLHGGGGRTRAEVEKVLKSGMSRSMIGSAVRFAGALRLKQLGEVDAAKAILASLPPWRPGSRLAKERAALEQEIA